MIINNFKANKYPFTANSTLEIMPGLTLAPERVISSILYPVVSSPENLRIKRLEKRTTNVALIVYAGNSEVCEIRFPVNTREGDNTQDPVFYAGYAVQNSELCGCLSVDKVFIELINALPDLEFADDAFVFAPSVCRLVVSANRKPGNILFNGTPVHDIIFVTEDGDAQEDWGVRLRKNELGEIVVDTADLVNSVKTNPVKKIYINGKDSYIDTQTHKHITITPELGTGLRVITERYGLTIGRFSEI